MAYRRRTYARRKRTRRTRRTYRRRFRRRYSRRSGSIGGRYGYTNHRIIRASNFARQTFLYCHSFEMNAAGGAYDKQVYRINSIHDPDYTNIGGLAASGAAFALDNYNYYLIQGCKVELWVNNQDAFSGMMFLRVAADAQTATPSTLTDAMYQSGHANSLSPFSIYTRKPQKITRFITIRRYLTREQILQNSKTRPNENPVNPLYLEIYTYNTLDTGLGDAAITIQCRLTMYGKLMLGLPASQVQ